MKQVTSFIQIIFLFLLYLSPLGNKAFSQNHALQKDDKIDIVLKDGSIFKHALLLYQDSIELFVYYQKMQKHILKKDIDFVEKSKNKIAVFVIGGGSQLVGAGISIFTKKVSLDFSFLPTGIAVGAKYYFKNTKKPSKWKKYVGASLSTFNVDFFGKSTYANQYINIGTSSFSGSMFLAIDV